MLLTPLPIDGLLPEIAGHLRFDLPRTERGPRVIVVAPPGAGKTTRTPPSLLPSLPQGGKVVVSEPRRLAARLSATRVSSERGLELGKEVGYRVRFDDRTSPETRIVFETEGLLKKRLLGADLEGVSVIVLDEVHERSADLDVILALLERPGLFHLPVIAMSATPDLETLSAFWNTPPVVRSEGRAYPVEIRHQPKPDDRPLEIQVGLAVRERLDADGNLLVFLPGAAEIQRAEAALTERLIGTDIEILPLHGDLPLDQQARAVGSPRPGEVSKRRIVLSTNVAETSVTVHGVTTVIDCGLARVARHDAISGAHTLSLEEISQARAIQRAGRAGRTAPGVCLRLYTRGNFDARPAQEAPEVLRIDLTEVLLDLLAHDQDPSLLRFPTPPPTPAWDAAWATLGLLGAVEEGRITPLGRTMATLPLPPRVARFVVEAKALGVGYAGAVAGALLSERDPKRQATFAPLAQRKHEHGRRESSDSDLEDRLELLDRARDARMDARILRELGLDRNGVRTIEEVAGRLLRTLGIRREPCSVPTSKEESALLTRALLAGFGDRVAERRGHSRVLLLSTGAEVELSEESAVDRAPLLLVLAADRPRGGRSRAVCRMAVRLSPDELLEFASDRVTTEETLSYDPQRDVVEETSSLLYGRLCLDSSRSRARPGKATGAVLLRAAETRGPAVYDPEGKLERLLVRIALVREHFPKQFEEAEAPAGADLAQADLRRLALERATTAVVSLAELARSDLSETLLGVLAEASSGMLTELLRREAPESVPLAGGRKASVHYEPGRAPFVESRLQDFFSMTKTPQILGGRVPLALHLLAPNRRAVQVTSDLPSFWERHYPELRRQLMRRYPKHAWPEDGRTASPPPLGKLR